jgi:putative transcriptional regulator
MTGAEIKGLREALGLTQVQLSQLLGVHPLTLSKWERGGPGGPTPHQMALLESFRKAKIARQDIGATVAGLLVTAGIAIALYTLLDAAFSKE